VTVFFLVRHAHHDWLGRGLAGRTDVPLSAAGLDQAERLAHRLARERLDAVQSSPLLRTRQTADAVARRCALEVEEAPDILEVDFGGWTGRDFDELERDGRWRRWNAFRSAGRCPGGESMTEAQARFVGHLTRLHEERPGARVALVGHADPIRSVLAYWLGAPLDLFLRIEVSPASISAVELGDWGPRVLSINECVPE
jgi:ribonuclease H / adenosylcobalamin/alpha-ribazole phosphatase